MPPTPRRESGAKKSTPKSGARHGKPAPAASRYENKKPPVDLAVLAAAVGEAVSPALADAGFAVEAVVLRRAGSRTVVDVTVDREGPLDLDAVAEASRLVETVLDADPETVPGVYVLEVGTRGADTPLTLPRHWRRAVGRLVTCTVDGAKTTGRVAEVAPGDAPDVAVVLTLADGRTLTTTADAAGRAVVQLEFTHHGADDGLDPEDDIDEDDTHEADGDDEADDDTDDRDHEQDQP